MIPFNLIMTACGIKRVNQRQKLHLELTRENTPGCEALVLGSLGEMHQAFDRKQVSIHLLLGEELLSKLQTIASRRFALFGGHFRNTRRDREGTSLGRSADAFGCPKDCLRRLAIGVATSTGLLHLHEHRSILAFKQTDRELDIVFCFGVHKVLVFVVDSRNGLLAQAFRNAIPNISGTIIDVQMCSFQTVDRRQRRQRTHRPSALDLLRRLARWCDFIGDGG
mmetsp:Transcript_14249/g.29545  ORF Transcript_14249/g.29545 Transcript_14249/m.29545 type:complete len:223 (+) Transcript_14249:392-1060(+)